MIEATRVDGRVETFIASGGVELRYTRRGMGGRSAFRTPGSERLILVAPGLLMSRDCTEQRELAGRLTEIADVVTVDVRGHGDSGGIFSWGRQEPDDLAALADLLRRRDGYQRVGGLGFSYGGYHVGAAAVHHRTFEAVAMVATPRSLFVFERGFLARGLIRYIPVALRRRPRLRRLGLRGLARRPAAMLNLVGRISPVPLLIAHGAADRLVSPTHAADLYERAAEPKSLALIDGARHAESIVTDNPEPLVESLLTHFERWL